jgi:hypothetical protein
LTRRDNYAVFVSLSVMCKSMFMKGSYIKILLTRTWQLKGRLDKDRNILATLVSLVNVLSEYELKMLFKRLVAENSDIVKPTSATYHTFHICVCIYLYLHLQMFYCQRECSVLLKIIRNNTFQLIVAILRELVMRHLL